MWSVCDALYAFVMSTGGGRGVTCVRGAQLSITKRRRLMLSGWGLARFVDR